MACPYFIPTHPADDIAWMHPSRLPLGMGWSGQCGAPGYDGSTPSADELKEHCNLGYAYACPRLPVSRDCDAIRFLVVRDSGAQLSLCFVLESRHRPAGHGTLDYHAQTSQWISRHPNAIIQRMAECYVQSYLSRKTSRMNSSLAIAEINSNSSGQENSHGAK